MPQAEVTCKAVAQALSELEHDVQIIEVGPRLLIELGNAQPDAVFNIATGYHTKKDQANIAAMLELSGIPFTGSNSTAHLAGLQKHISKMTFRAHNVPTPNFHVIYDNQSVHGLFEGFPVPGHEFSHELPVPVIVKPGAEGSSIGIFPESVTQAPVQARSLAAKLLDSLDPPVLIEEYIPGREFTVAVIGYPQPSALPVEEIVFDNGDMYTYGVKTRDSVKPVCPAQISEKLSHKIQDTALRAFEAIGCRDIGRVDIRLSEDEQPFVLEINTLPGLMPDYSEVPRIAQAAGISYSELVGIILQGALRRGNQKHIHPSM
ncbi:MAG TPA: ATP-grasp domain-containing protein [Firmicutes bacterium]|nr:ATP-grasp domain-containing protein [Candidatus Fermentithermobacillaceae bacterium]